MSSRISVKRILQGRIGDVVLCAFLLVFSITRSDPTCQLGGVVLAFQTLTVTNQRHGTRQSLKIENVFKRPVLPITSLRAELPSSSSSSNSRRQSARHQQHRDVVIVGGGLAGLATALYLTQIDPSRHVTILDRQDPTPSKNKQTTVASFAAAGMLAPQSERLPKGDLLDLCMQSRRMYADFCDLVESLAEESGEDGRKYLIDDPNDDKPWSVGYIATGGFLAPAFAGDSVATWAPPEMDQDDGVAAARWLDSTQVRELEPNLHPDVVGGWWFPEDASVDARRLTCSLRAACVSAGVHMLMGPDYEITSLDLADGVCRGLWVESGRYISANSVLLANGAWMRNLLPVPIEPHKGQSLSLRMPTGTNSPPLLRRVLFAQDSYIVPKADGRIVIGATVEAGSFDGNVTPAGMLHILSHALQLVPALKDLPIEETWAGLRPTTPDKGPVMGETLWKNLYLAGGYWRNGVLLAPKTGHLLATLISKGKDSLSESDKRLLNAFSWDRFTAKGGGVALSANARYAASVHPIHSRRSGAGVAASVGTELGTYSSARSAREERKRDRSSLWDSDNELEGAFERAAALGKTDSQAYTFGDDANVSLSDMSRTMPFEGSADALTVGSSTVDDDESSEEESVSSASIVEESTVEDLSAVYEKIKQNKAKQNVQLDSDDAEEEKPDPGFRVYYEDPETGETHTVPPFTAPGDFLDSLKGQSSVSEVVSSRGKVEETSSGRVNGTAKNISDDISLQTSEYTEQTFDGYQDIQQANSRKTREEELEAMRAARQRNRFGQEDIDESKIGASRPESNILSDGDTEAEEMEETPPKSSSQTPYDLQTAYKKIQENKSKQATPFLDLTEDEDSSKPDPGFRVYYEDPDSGETYTVPPYTSPGEFMDSLKQNSDDVASNDASPANSTSTMTTAPPSSSPQEWNEQTFDGYTDIQQANTRATREEELQAMREVRQRNRLDDDSKGGASDWLDWLED